MADYKKMYTVLCAAVDDVIDPLEQIPEARNISKSLHAALLEAEEIYIKTTPILHEDNSIEKTNIDYPKFCEF